MGGVDTIRLAGIAFGLTCLASFPAAAHVDTVFPILPNGFLQRFPDEYGPASLQLAPPSAELPGVPSSARVRIGQHEVELPLCIRKLLAIPASQRVSANGSWYHDFELIPPYVSFEFPLRRGEGDEALAIEGHSLMFDMRHGSLIEVKRSEMLSRGGGRSTRLDPAERCDASELQALVPRRTAAPIPDGAFDEGHGKNIADCQLTGSAEADARCLRDRLTATDESYAIEAGWFASCEKGDRSEARLADWRRFRAHFCQEHLQRSTASDMRMLERLRCELELTEASFAQLSELAYTVCVEAGRNDRSAQD